MKLKHTSFRARLYFVVSIYTCVLASALRYVVDALKYLTTVFPPLVWLLVKLASEHAALPVDSKGNTMLPS